MYELEIGHGTNIYELRFETIPLAWFGSFGWMRIRNYSVYLNPKFTEQEFIEMNRVIDIAFNPAMDMDYS